MRVAEGDFISSFWFGRVGEYSTRFSGEKNDKEHGGAWRRGVFQTVGLNKRQINFTVDEHGESTKKEEKEVKNEGFGGPRSGFRYKRSTGI